MISYDIPNAFLATLFENPWFSFFCIFRPHIQKQYQPCSQMTTGKRKEQNWTQCPFSSSTKLWPITPCTCVTFNWKGLRWSSTILNSAEVWPELGGTKRVHNYTQPNLLNRTHVWHWTGRDALDPGGETGHLSPGLWAQHVPPRQLEFKRSKPNVTFQILYVLTMVTLTNYAVCIISAVLCRDVVSQVPQCLWVALPECS